MDVLLTGTYSSSNKGDLAMQLTAARELEERGVAVTASVPFPERDRSVYTSHGIEVIPSNRRKLVRASWQVLRLMLWRTLRRLPERLTGWLIPDRDIARFRSSDLVVDLSGDMLTDDYGPHVAYSHFLPLVVARLCGTPYAILAQSIGPFRYTTPLARSVLRHAALVTVRDPISIANVEGLGLPAPEMTADLAFLLQRADDNTVDAVWASEDLPGGRVMGVSISGLVTSHYERRNSLGARRPLHLLLAETLDEVAGENDLEVVFFPHVTGPTEAKDDRVTAGRVAAAMEHTAHVISGDHSPDVIKGLIRRCYVFIGARMHANIAALSSSVPTVAIAYSHKTSGIMQLLDLDDAVIDIADVTREGMTELAGLVLADHDKIADHLKDRLPSVRARSAENIEAVMRLLDRGTEVGS